MGDVMSGIDYFFLGLLAVGLLYGLLRGLVMQAATVAGVIAGVLVSGRFSGMVGDLLSHTSSWLSQHPWVANRIAYGIVFIGIQAAAQIVGYLLRDALKQLRFGKADRVLGGATGLLVAAAVCVVISMLLVPSEGAEPPDSVLIPFFIRAASEATIVNSSEKVDRFKKFIEEIEKKAKAMDGAAMGELLKKAEEAAKDMAKEAGKEQKDETPEADAKPKEAPKDKKPKAPAAKE
jgi:membrane protein required for colicin V production